MIRSLCCLLALLSGCSTRIELSRTDAGLDAGARDAGLRDDAGRDAEPSLDARLDAGSDARACLPTETRCGSRCADLTADVENCGACGFDCHRVPHTVGPVGCVHGRCVYGGCEPGWAFCTLAPFEYCETSVATSERCGGCDYACPELYPFCEPYEREPGAVAFRCVGACADGLTLCGSACVDLQRDEASCGACGEACAQVPNGVLECELGVCRRLRCALGSSDCDGDVENGCETDGPCR